MSRLRTRLRGTQLSNDKSDPAKEPVSHRVIPDEIEWVNDKREQFVRERAGRENTVFKIGETLNLDFMEAGRDLDQLIAEKVMGWRHGQSDTYCEPPFVSCPVCSTPFSSNIAAAWLVAEKVAQPRSVKFNVHTRIGKWACLIITNVGTRAEAQFFAYAETAPLAICRTALKAVQENLS